MKFIKKIFIYFSLIILVLAAGCFNEKAEYTGIQISSLSTSIGAEKEGPDNWQKVSYTVTLYNDTNQEIYISFIEPLLNNEIFERLVKQGTRLDINKRIEANSSLNVEGQFVFDAADLSKQEIAALKPIIKGFRLVTESVITLP
jgi:hypothetical protein